MGRSKRLQESFMKMPQSSGSGGQEAGALSGNRDILSQLGSARSMPGPVQAKMEGALGADFSGVELFESPVVSQHGAEAAASGNKVAFAPGKLDLGSSAGLELLGHELSHVAAQGRGQVSGHGFVNDSAQERRADADGKKAAAFDPMSGATLTPMSGGLSASASAPVQARKGQQQEVTRGDLFRQDYASKDLPGQVRLMSDFARMSSLSNDVDESEYRAYERILKKVGPEFMEEMLNQQVAAGAAVNGMVKENTRTAPGLRDYTRFNAQHSEEADRFQSYSTLLMNMGMNAGNEAGYEQYRELTRNLMENDEGARNTLTGAQDIIMHGGESRWAEVNAAGLKGLLNRERSRQDQFVEDWNGSRNQRVADANRGGIFSRLFRRRR